AGDDGVKAFAAVKALEAAPGQAVPVFKGRLKPAYLDAEKVEKWIADLGHGDFKVRQRASQELENLGVMVSPALRKALDRDPPPVLDVRKKLEALLAGHFARALSGEELRAVRAIEVLERIGTTEAKDALKSLADGAPAAPATMSARAALG